MLTSVLTLQELDQHAIDRLKLAVHAELRDADQAMRAIEQIKLPFSSVLARSGGFVTSDYFSRLIHSFEIRMNDDRTCLDVS